jgi:hypothetical protein
MAKSEALMVVAKEEQKQEKAALGAALAATQAELVVRVSAHVYTSPCPLKDPERSLKDDAQCSLHGARCSLKHIKCSLNGANMGYAVWFC